MISTLLTVAFSLASLSNAYTLPKRDALLRLPISATATNVSEILSQTKRQTVGGLQNVQTGTRYMIDFTIGTPAQSVAVALDTGSSETWVDPNCVNAGSTNTDLCNTFPVYNPATSTSAIDLGTQNTLSYGKGSADIEYYTDNFVIGGATIKAQQFGVATTSSDIPTGLMGVGPAHELVGYNTIIDELALQGVTQSRAFSLDLRSVDSPDGAIIFGGIDSMKYTGALEKCPIIPAAESPDQFDRYWIQMASVGITKPGEAPKTYPASATPVFLDSGGTLSRLPTPLFNAIIADFPGATEDGTSGLYTVDCSLTSQPGTVDFTFGGSVINVPYLEFIWQISGSCYVGLAADDEAPVLGDSFLRAAYVVYDQDNQNLLLANAASCGTNLIPIGKGADAVPSVTGGCGVASSTSSSASSSATSSSSISSSESLPTSSSTAAASSTSTTATSSSEVSSDTSAPSTSFVSTTSAPTSSLPESSATPSTSLPESSTASPASSDTSASIVSSTSSSAPSSSVDSILPTTSNVYIPTTTLSGASSTGISTNDNEPTSSFASTTQYSTSTVYATSVYTITSCAPTVTDCPARIGQVTTDIISLYTTVCPVTETTPAPTPTPTPTAWTISTVYATTTYTISSCAPTVVNCPYGSKTTETISLYTTFCPVTEAATSVAEIAYTVAASSVAETSYTTTTKYSTRTATVTTAGITSFLTSIPPPRQTYTVPVLSESTSEEITYTAPVSIPVSAPVSVPASAPASVPSKAATTSIPVEQPTGTSTAVGVATVSSTPSSTPLQFTGGAARLANGNMVMVGLAVAGFLFVL